MIIIYVYKAIKRILRYLKRTQWIIVFLKFKLNRVKFFIDFESNGIPVTAIGLNAKISIGHKFMMNNGFSDILIGRQQPCFFVVPQKGELIIGNNVGISATAIVCWNRIEIKDNVRIGGGTVIYDTDFHSLNYQDRLSFIEKQENIKTAPILIKESAFIGANCTILKGVTIGEKSIIGACSVVAKDVPANEVWAGNPAKFIRKI